MDELTLDLTIRGRQVRIAALHRPAPGAALVCLHGFGSVKEDYADLALRPEFDDLELLLYDAPGCGSSSIDDETAVTIPFLVAVAQEVTAHVGIERFHLSGHSMGGLTGLRLAAVEGGRVLSFFDIEGNLAPEDCFLSRQIVDHPASDDRAFFDAFARRVAARAEFGSRLYAATLDHRVRPGVVEPIFRSMVALSDDEDLLGTMAALECPRSFVHGEQNRHLSYLPALPGLGVEPVEIADSGHFPMYSNPPALWSALRAHLDRAAAHA